MILKSIIISILVFANGAVIGQISHADWNQLLINHVDEIGNVNYRGLKQDEVHLDSYLKFLSNNHPRSSWTDDEIKAYWINAYNAFTVKIILKHYPVKSIKDIGGIFYKVNTTWDIKFITIGDEKLDLNNIEHQKLREQFNDPRIHMAINCASFSCPKLRNEAYMAAKLENQLNDQTKYFINNPLKNDLNNPSNPKISKILSWYSGDFEANGNSVIGFINLYSNVKIPENASIDYLEYNWTLNEQKK